MRRALRHLWRIASILRSLARHNALFVLELIPQAKPFLSLIDRFVDHSAPGRPGQRLARALQEQGPAFIKLGQSLATRADLLGESSARDLSMLQDRLPPFPASRARATIEAELERPLDELFSDLDDVPVAAASIAQVHFASTTDGRPVAVKVLRPGIEAAFERDLDFLLWLAEVAIWIHPPLKRFRPVEAVEIFARSTRREMDLRLEAAAAVEFRENCRNDEGFRVPSIDWHRTARRVVTFERVEGLPLADREVLLAAGLDPDAILETAAVVFFNQVFRDGFFHADMHPGNMLVDSRTGDIVALDFGIMGRLDLPTRKHLAEVLVGFLTRDYTRVARVFFRAGFVPSGQDEAAFTQACRAIGEPILDLPLSQISFGRLLGQLLHMAEDFAMETQPQLLLLQKTMVVAEGVGRALNPSINMWQTAQPLVEAWIRAHLGPEAVLREMAEEAVATIGRLPRLVARLDEAFRDAESATRAHDRHPVRRYSLAAFALGLLVGVAFAWAMSTFR
jgi:ubiquinone biosynthesis protein